MINLLPLEERQKLILKKNEKLAVVLNIIIVVFLVCLTLVLLSIKFYILADTDNQKIALQQTQKEYQAPEFANLSSVIKKYNLTIAQLDSFYKKEIYFNQVFQIITSVPSPQGLYLTNFSLKRDAKGLVQVSASGASDTRDNLLIFQKNIEANGYIKNPYFSTESWINPKNVNFSLTFQIDSNEKQK